MDGHDAEFVTANLHVALDFAVRRAQPRQKTLQRRHRTLFELQRQLEIFVDRIIGLVGQTLEDPRAAAVLAEQPRIELVRSRASNALLARGEPGSRFGKA